MTIRTLYISILISLLGFLTGCKDEIIFPDGYGEGESTLSVNISFEKMFPALESRTAGDAIKSIDKLTVIAYQSDGSHVQTWRSYSMGESSDNLQFTTNNSTSLPNDYPTPEDPTKDPHQAETTTQTASFKLSKIPYDSYFFYVVANLEVTDDQVKTIERLKSISVNWNEENISLNNAMFGFFSDKNEAGIMPQSFDAPLLQVTAPNVSLSGWLKRTVSKVTVAYDGSDLEDDINIYIKSVRIKNIPKTCLLGQDNTVESEENLIENGEEIVYTNVTAFNDDYPALVSNQKPFYPRKTAADEATQDWKDEVHSETNNSLFFFENMQGSGESKPDKRQKDEDGDGLLDDLFPYQDMPYATYIEVDAHYESTNPDFPGTSDITYRFMLGKDVIQDYDAERNHHYKLTLHFNGFANEPDWRIDYKTFLSVTEPKIVDYQGKYFVPNGIEDTNEGWKFSKENVITVNSYAYIDNDWNTKVHRNFKIEYKHSESTEWSENAPDWLGVKNDEGSYTTDPLEDIATPEEKAMGLHKLKINYNNPYTEVYLSNNFGTGGSGDLSGGGSKSANCYIVDAPGTYSFPLIYGNAGADGESSYKGFQKTSFGNGEHVLENLVNYLNKPITSANILSDIYPNGIPEADKNKFTAEIVWQDVEGLVTPTKQVDVTGSGKITFTVKTPAEEGNAVIALKDPSGETMWSWHIWVTSIDRTKNVTLTNSAGSKFEIMPVNLGWCSGGKPLRYYDRHVCEVKITQENESGENYWYTVKIIQEPHIAVPRGNNPYYQWGRKDPFIAAGQANSGSISGTEGEEIYNTAGNKTWYNSSGQEQTGNPPYLWEEGTERTATQKALGAMIQNPGKWQNCPRILNFEGSGFTGPFIPDDVIYYNLWTNSVKTVYDPSPYGYQVSPGGTFSGFCVNGNPSFNPNVWYSVLRPDMLEDYRENLFEFYTDHSKLISLGFPENGYRDWDYNAMVLQFNLGQIWEAEAKMWSWGYPTGDGKWSTEPYFIAFHFEFDRVKDIDEYPGPTEWEKDPDKNNYGYVRPQNSFYATDGFPVRPTKPL